MTARIDGETIIFEKNMIFQDECVEVQQEKRQSISWEKIYIFNYVRSLFLPIHLVEINCGALWLLAVPTLISSLNHILESEKCHFNLP